MLSDDQALVEIKEELKELRKIVMRLVNYEEFKKESKSNLINFIRVAVLLIPMAMAGIGYFAYETGLYKPVPHASTIKK